MAHSPDRDRVAEHECVGHVRAHRQLEQRGLCSRMRDELVVSYKTNTAVVLMDGRGAKWLRLNKQDVCVHDTMDANSNSEPRERQVRVPYEIKQKIRNHHDSIRTRTCPGPPLHADVDGRGSACTSTFPTDCSDDDAFVRATRFLGTQLPEKGPVALPAKITVEQKYGMIKLVPITHKER